MHMASSRKNFLPSLQQNYLYQQDQYQNANNNNNIMEFDESDVWKSNDQISTYSEAANTMINKKKSSSRTTSAMKIPSSRTKTDYPSGRPIAPGGGGGGMSSSVPVNIPDWSKIYRSNCTSVVEDEYDNEGDEDDRLPPHEYVARQVARNRSVAYSVHEGIGRTLKGRDLSKVRNAIWKQTGFED